MRHPAKRRRLRTVMQELIYPDFSNSALKMTQLIDFWLSKPKSLHYNADFLSVGAHRFVSTDFGWRLIRQFQFQLRQ